jgi:hypothetical protein
MVISLHGVIGCGLYTLVLLCNNRDREVLMKFIAFILLYYGMVWGMIR